MWWWQVVCLCGWLCQYVSFVRWLKEKMMCTLYTLYVHTILGVDLNFDESYFLVLSYVMS